MCKKFKLITVFSLSAYLNALTYIACILNAVRLYNACIFIIYTTSLFPCFVFGLLTYSLLISIIALQHVHCSLMNWSS